MDEAYTKDVSEIVPAILQGKFAALGNSSIMDVFGFTAADQKKVDELVEEFRTTEDDENVKIPSKDIRLLFAALRRAFETNPNKYIESGYGEAVLNHIATRVIDKGVRSGETKLKGASLITKLRVYRSASEDLIEGILTGFERSHDQPGEESN